MAKSNTALPIRVYTNGSDSTNGGISSSYKTLLLIDKEGWVDIDGTEENLVEVVTHMGNPIIVPYAQPAKAIGPMFGGNFTSSSDSRFMRIVQKATGARFYGAIPIHDRFEAV